MRPRSFPVKEENVDAAFLARWKWLEAVSTFIEYNIFIYGELDKLSRMPRTGTSALWRVVWFPNSYLGTAFAHGQYT